MSRRKGSLSTMEQEKAQKQAKKKELESLRATREWERVEDSWLHNGWSREELLDIMAEE